MAVSSLHPAPAPFLKVPIFVRGAEQRYNKTSVSFKSSLIFHLSFFIVLGEKEPSLFFVYERFELSKAYVGLGF